jgi:uncharacterized membrane protein YkoI
MIAKSGWLQSSVTCVSLFVVSAAVVTAAEQEGEQNEIKVQLKDCPEAVQKTIKKEAGDGKIVEVEKEREDGTVVYEAEVIIDGQEYEITVAEDGKLLGKEKEGADDDDSDDKDEAGGKDKAK